MVKKLYLVRHGKIDSGKERRYIGNTDLPLDKEGENQAKKLQNYFTSIEIDKAYASPLIRCVETARKILENKNITANIVDGLREINMGEWEYKSFAYIKESFSKEYQERGKAMDSYAPPKGESFRELQQRVMPIFNEIIKGGDENILIVAHAGVNRVIISKLLNLPLKDLMNIKQPYGCVNFLRPEGRNGNAWEWNMI